MGARAGQGGPGLPRYRLVHIQPTRIFRAIVYNKSDVVLHISTADWRRRVLPRHPPSLLPFQQVGTDDVRAAFEKESEQDLKRSSARGLAARARRSWTFRGRVADGAAPEVALRIEHRGKDSEFPVTVDAAVCRRRTEAAQVVVASGWPSSGCRSRAP